MNTEIHQLTQSDLIDKLFEKTPYFVTSHLIGLIYAAIVYIQLTKSSAVLLTWLCLLGFSATLAICIAFGYRLRGRNNTLSNKFIWRAGFLANLALCSGIYAFGLTTLIPAEDPTFVYVSGLFTLCFLAVSSILFAFSKLAIICVNVPLGLTALLFYGNYEVGSGLLVAITTAIFAIFLVSVANHQAKVFKDAIWYKREASLAIEKFQQIEHQQREIDRRDGLTGIFNRRYFYEMLEQEIGRASRNHTSLSLLLVDIDHFKDYNEHYGHIEGDQRLIEVAHILSQQLNRKGDFIARYNGGQFVCILPHIDMQGAIACGEKMQEAVQHSRLEHQTTKLTFLKSITISVGVTSLPLMSRISARTLLQQAENALKQAKMQGRNRVKRYVDTDFDQDHI